jgi:hypothetical protein
MPEFARLSRFTVETNRADDAVRFFNDTDLHEAEQSSGFRRGFWLLDRASGSGVEMVVFESREALEAAEEEERGARERAVSAGVNLSGEETYEVVAEGRPAR